MSNRVAVCVYGVCALVFWGLFAWNIDMAFVNPRPAQSVAALLAVCTGFFAVMTTLGCIGLALRETLK